MRWRRETDMAVHVARDWRGLKFRVSDCSREELRNLLRNAQQTQAEVGRFIDHIENELGERNGGRCRAHDLAG